MPYDTDLSALYDHVLLGSIDECRAVVADLSAASPLSETGLRLQRLLAEMLAEAARRGLDVAPAEAA